RQRAARYHQVIPAVESIDRVAALAVGDRDCAGLVEEDIVEILRDLLGVPVERVIPILPIARAGPVNRLHSIPGIIAEEIEEHEHRLTHLWADTLERAALAGQRVDRLGSELLARRDERDEEVAAGVG